MAKAYFIGGAPRVGKSTLAKAFLAEHPMTFAATDDLRASRRTHVSASIEPDLYYLDSLNHDESNMARLMAEETSSIVAAADRESSLVWQTIESLVRQTLAAGHDILVEGVAVLPRLVATLDIDLTVVYLGNQSPDHTGIIHAYAQSHPKTWLGSLKPGTIDAFATFTQAYSAHIKSEAALYHQPYIEMGGTKFETSLTKALNTLH
jgi:predicted kinase